MFGTSKPPQVQGDEFGQEVVSSQGESPTKVQGAETQPLCYLRPATGVHAKVWNVQDLL
jgi:hypothetical protein